MTGVLGAASGRPLTEGERWIRAELTRLRDSGWRPRTVLRFLCAGQTRANHTRRWRPTLARQEAGWIPAGAGGWLVAARLLRRVRSRVRETAVWHGGLAVR